MKFSVLVISALHSLKGNARRTILTMLGIIIGIASVITIMSLGKGFQKMAISGLAGEDNGRVSVQFFYQPNNPERIDRMTTPFSQQDRLAIEAIEGVLETKEPEKRESDTFYTQVETLKSDEVVNVGLVTNDSNIDVIHGDPITAVDVDASKKVAVIDTRLAEALYHSPEQAVGRGITISGDVYYIKGVKLSQQSDVLTTIFSGEGPYQAVNIPATTYRHYHETKTPSHALKVFIKPGYVSSEVAKKVQDYLNTKGSQRSLGKYEYMDIAAQLDAIGKVLDGLTYFISAVAGISLFIAGVGVMNMMYISVSERTKEIGIRRAMGATKQSIQLQFLLEGIVITFSGGIVGYLLGILVAAFIAGFLPFQMYTDLSAVLLAVGISVAIGIIFSVFPAKSAANKDVIEILR